MCSQTALIQVKKIIDVFPELFFDLPFAFFSENHLFMCVGWHIYSNHWLTFSDGESNISFLTTFQEVMARIFYFRSVNNWFHLDVVGRNYLLLKITNAPNRRVLQIEKIKMKSGVKNGVVA